VEKIFSFEEIILNKATFQACLKKFLDFGQISIYLAKNHESKNNSTTNFKISFLKEEKKLLLSLVGHNNQKIIFSIDSIDPTKVQKILPQLSNIINLILTNIQLKEKSKLDPYTNTLNLKYFIEKLSSHIENISEHIMVGPKSLIVSDMDSLHGRFAVAAIKLFGSQNILDIGFEKWVQGIGQASQTIISFSSYKNTFFNQKNIFYVLFKNDLHNIRKRLTILYNKLKKQSLELEHLQLDPLIVYLIYPNDVPGYLLKKQSKELSYEILQLLEKTFDLIKSHTSYPKDPIPLAEIWQKWGIIEDVLTENLVKINIGEDLGIRCGQCFGVLNEENNNLKAELLITHTNRNYSRGEIIFFNNPFKKIKPGDKIIFLKDHEIKEIKSKSPKKVKNLHNFLTTFYQKAKDCKQFSIIMTRGEKENINRFTKFLRNKTNQPILIERFGLETLISFIPHINLSKHTDLFNDLQTLAMENPSIVIGITNYPLLNLSKYETIRFSIDSLEHAALLPPPKIAVFDSITFNLRGDKYFIKGDIYSATQEYKRSLILDSKNHIARNSLGICYAKIGDIPKALEEFQLAAKENPSITFLYNLGSASLRLGDHKQAKDAFLKCIQQDPNHVYSIIRLAQLFELEGKLTEAQNWLKKVDPNAHPQVYRYQAKIHLKKGKINEAKECLENAIRQNPMDAESIFLLGRIYIEWEQDLKTGESLIKKSISLKPDKIEYKVYLSHLNSTPSQILS
jgi:tetratricopeptide (TPR) repeat protein